MEVSPEAPSELALLLQRIATTLPPETHILVLRHLPVPELARLSCVHKVFHVAWRSLQEQQPGERFAPPAAGTVWRTTNFPRLSRAAYLGDVAFIRFMLAAGVDEHGAPLLEALYRPRFAPECRVVDEAMQRAAVCGHVQAVHSSTLAQMCMLMTIGRCGWHHWRATQLLCSCSSSKA